MRGLFRNIVDHFEEYVTTILFVIMSVFVFLQIVTRYVLNDPLLIAEEAARFSYVWMSFIGLSLATKENDHIRIDLLHSLLPEKGEKILSIVIDCVSMVLLIAISFFSVKYVQFAVYTMASAMEISMAWVFISFPIGTALAVIRLFLNIRKNINEIRKEEK